jgi:mRNA-degrading endonuclease RelE of RelBE toxin-antitoxin system
MEMKPNLVTIVETHSFQKQCQKVLDESEIDELKNFLAINPKAGDVIPGLRGIRKVRWQANQKGKSGGARIIYFFYNQNVPVFLLDIYAKSDKGDLSSQDKKIMNAMVDELIESYGG